MINNKSNQYAAYLAIAFSVSLSLKTGMRDEWLGMSG